MSLWKRGEGSVKKEESLYLPLKVVRLRSEADVLQLSYLPSYGYPLWVRHEIGRKDLCFRLWLL